MKIYKSILLILILSITVAQAQLKPLAKVTITTIPTSTEDFLALRNKIALTPEGGAAIFALAMKIYTKDKALGKQCLVIASDVSLLVPSKGGYKGFSIHSSTWGLVKRQLKTYPYLPNSYIAGSSPKQGYKTSLPFTFEAFTNPYSGSVESGSMKIFVSCTGANSPRPIKLSRNRKGYWKAKEYSSLLVGIQPPRKELTEEDGDF